MNNSIFESIFAVFDDKPPFLSILDTFWPIFGHFSYSTSINHSLTIELNNILNWITRVYFELNNILNWILGKAILNRILNESFFGKIQILNWIRLGIVNHYPHSTAKYFLTATLRYHGVWTRLKKSLITFPLLPGFSTNQLAFLENNVMKQMMKQ